MSEVHICTVDDCKEPAVALYQWPWEDHPSACCSRHQFMLHQKAETLGRPVTISPLHVAAPPMALDERQQMHAAILARNDEIEQLKSRGAELYKQNQDVIAEARRLAARNGELDTQIRELKAKLVEVNKERDEMTVQRNQLSTDLERTRILVQNQAPKPAQGQS